MQSSSRTIKSAALVVLVLIVGLACDFGGEAPATATAMPPTPTVALAAQNLSLVSTIAAQTVEAQMALLTSQARRTPLPTYTALPTYTPLPTYTFVPSPTPTRPSPAITVVTTFVMVATQIPLAPVFPAAPQLVAVVGTNCRAGSAASFARVGYLAPGEISYVNGRNENSSWWYVQNPQAPGAFCWVSADTTAVSGDIAVVPFIGEAEVLPEPSSQVQTTVSFQASFANVHTCFSQPLATIMINNDGNSEFESDRLTLREISGGGTLFGPEINNSPFMASAASCPPGAVGVNPGDVAFLGGTIPALKSGTSVRAQITLCTEPGLGGNCVEKHVDFTTP